MRLHRFAGKLALQNRTLTFSDGRLDSSGITYRVAGTTSFARELKMTLTGDGKHSFDITGTLERPRVAPLLRPQTEAAMK